jgi:ssDNA-binding Zn-finger/Zn-ribbon topoisomerase 1
MPVHDDPARKECPLCGESMRLKQSRTLEHVPGNPGATPRTVAEWVCPECDYFEEAGSDGT